MSRRARHALFVSCHCGNAGVSVRLRLWLTDRAKKDALLTRENQHHAQTDILCVKWEFHLSRYWPTTWEDLNDFVVSLVYSFDAWNCNLTRKMSVYVWSKILHIKCVYFGPANPRHLCICVTSEVSLLISKSQIKLMFCELGICRYFPTITSEDVLDQTWFVVKGKRLHYNDVIMGAIASQITSLMIVYSTVYSGADQRKHQSSASLAFARGIHRWPVNSPYKGPVTRKMFPFDDVIVLPMKYLLPMRVWRALELGGL